MNQLLLAYYGDDFTGSTDVMDVLARAGLRTVLFMEPPSGAQLAPFRALRAFGVAGGSRSLSPEDMDRTLPPALEALRASGAPLVHYKVCSTFDSSPQIGSIGRALEIGRQVFGPGRIPMVVGAPSLGRYVAFGNLFARSGLDSEPSRLDRHPTMRCHPVTPMAEADLRLHLRAQTDRDIALFDVLQIEASDASDARNRLPADGPVLFDTLNEAHLARIGRWVWEDVLAGRTRFSVSSSGLEHALVAWWRKAALLSPPPPEPAPATPHPLLVVSGSCSPVTSRQIGRALAAGALDLPLDPLALLNGIFPEETLRLAADALRANQSVVLHTSRGTEDRRRLPDPTPGQRTRLGTSLGHCIDRILSGTPIRRTVVCGGDTGLDVARALGIVSLEFLAPLAPGGPWCRAAAPGRAADTRAFLFKGGQVGRDAILLDAARTHLEPAPIQLPPHPSIPTRNHPFA